MKNLSIVLTMLGTVACSRGAATTDAPTASSAESAGAESTVAPVASATVHMEADGRSAELAHGYAVPQQDGSMLIALSSVELSCGYLAFLGMGTPAPDDHSQDYEIFYTRALPWAVADHPDTQLMGIAVRDGGMGGANSDHTDVSILSAPTEAGARGRVRASAAGDPDWAFVPAMNGEVDVEVCAS